MCEGNAALYRLYIGHRRRRVHCTGTDVPVLKMTASAYELSNMAIACPFVCACVYACLDFREAF